MKNDPLYSRVEELEMWRQAASQDLQGLKAHAAAMAQWKASIEESTRVQREMIEVGKDLAGAIRVMGWIGSGIKWLAVTGGAAAMIYAKWKG